MADARAAIEKRFVDRIAAPRVAAAVGYRGSRLAIAFGLAAIPLVVVSLAVWLGPPALAKAMTSANNVHETFARFVTAVATASAIAVSVASLTLNREMKGLGTFRKRHEDNARFREDLRQASGRISAPLTIAGYLRETLDVIAEESARARGLATAKELAMTQEGLSLGDLLGLMEKRARDVAPTLDAARRHPDKVLSASLEFETDVAGHLLRAFGRRLEDGPLAEALEAIQERALDYSLTQRYLKTLDTSWGLSNMSWAILLATLPSLLTAAFMVLAYGEGAVETLGRTGAGVLVGAAMSVTLLPLAIFVSFVLRFVFLNEHTLPADGFILGPEADDVVTDRGARRSGRGRAA